MFMDEEKLFVHVYMLILNNGLYVMNIHNYNIDHIFVRSVIIFLVTLYYEYSQLEHLDVYT